MPAAKTVPGSIAVSSMPKKIKINTFANLLSNDVVFTGHLAFITCCQRY
jgi:hypothetical protein